MPDERHHSVSHEMLMDRLRWLGRGLAVIFVGLLATFGSLVSSCMGTRDLVLTHEQRLAVDDREIDGLKRTDDGVRDVLMSINEKVGKIGGALGIRDGSQR